MEAGDPRLVVEGVDLGSGSGSGPAQYSVSDNGTLAYMSPQPQTPRQVVWVDRSGSAREPWGVPIEGAHASQISPSGTRALLTAANTALFVLQDGQDPLVLPIGTAGISTNATWTPAGDEIVYEGVDGLLYRIAADGSGRPQPVGPREGHRHPLDWTADGALICVEISSIGAASIWSLSLAGSDEPSEVVVGDFIDGVGGAALSPDGRTLAFTRLPAYGTPSGIFVMQLPDGNPQRVSNVGGQFPVWSVDGSELYFSNGQDAILPNGDAMMVVSFIDGDPTRPEPPRELFRAPDLAFSPFDVAEDGRFLMIGRGESTTRLIHVVVNWFEELKRLVPTDR